MRLLQGLLFALMFVVAGTAVVGAQMEMQHGEHGTLEELVVESADTPQQHEALARYFRGKADDMRRMAAKHRSMGEAYQATKMVQQQRMKQHCSDLAAGFEKAAQDYEDMAKEHDAAAKR